MSINSNHFIFICIFILYIQIPTGAANPTSETDKTKSSPTSAIDSTPAKYETYPIPKMVLIAFMKGTGATLGALGAVLPGITFFLGCLAAGAATGGSIGASIGEGVLTGEFKGFTKKETITLDTDEVSRIKDDLHFDFPESHLGLSVKLTSWAELITDKACYKKSTIFFQYPPKEDEQAL